MTYQQLVADARIALEHAGIAADVARLDAELLARHVVQWDRATWLIRRDEEVGAGVLEPFARLIARRAGREPMAYIRGVQAFWGRDFEVTPAVLIPRPETEIVVEAALAVLKGRPAATVVDVGTGSGCIAITLALECPGARIFATDISAEALDVARRNAYRLDPGHRVQFILGAYLATAPPAIDLIVSNPPYVAAGDGPGLPPEVMDYEPAQALFSGEDGLRDARGLLRAAQDALAPGGRLIMEVGYGHVELVSHEIEALENLTLEDTLEDLQGIPRVVMVRRASS